MICSRDGKPCCDDLCYGGGCIRGGVGLHHCTVCNTVYCDDEGCACDEERAAREDAEHEWDPYPEDARS